MIIGFDFDKVFINYPPFIPYFLIDFLYKGESVFKKNPSKKSSLHYRIPGRVEQKIRILSHHPIFRTPIKENVDALKEISGKDKVTTYLVSSRFSFLKKRTDGILKKYSLDKYFDGVHFNYDNKQPHIFKEETIKKLKIDTYIDDDLQLSLFLSKSLPHLKIFWVKNGNAADVELPKNVIPIKNLKELNKHLKLT